MLTRCSVIYLGILTSVRNRGAKVGKGWHDLASESKPGKWIATSQGGVPE